MIDPRKEYSVHVHLSDEQFQAIKAIAKDRQQPLKRFLSKSIVLLDEYLKGKDDWENRPLDRKAKNRLIGLSQPAHRHLKHIANNTDQHNWEVMAHLIIELIEVKENQNDSTHN